MSSKVINLTTPDNKSKSGKRAKSASPTLGSKSNNSSSTSIIDSILKERTTTGKASPGKKLIIDLAKDNFIITDAKPSSTDNLNKPQPIKPLVSKPIDRVILDVPPPTNNNKIATDEYDLDLDIDNPPSDKKKTGRKLPATAAGSLGNSAVSREKMDKLKALDAVFLRSTPSPIPEINLPPSLQHKSPTQQIQGESPDPLDFIFNDIAPPLRVSPDKQLDRHINSNSITKKLTSPTNTSPTNTSPTNDIKIIKPLNGSGGTTNKTTSMQDMDLTRQKLDSVNRNIAKIQTKITEKGAKEKYAVMLKDLEKQKQKYESRLATTTATAVAISSIKPKSLVYPPPSYQESMLGQPVSPRTSPIPSKPKSPITLITGGEKTTKQIAQEERIATDRELARIRELFPDQKSNNTSAQTSQKRPKEVESLFNVSNNLETLKEKQRHLEQQHKKMEQQYAHKLKQIERMRTQKEEITKLSALEHERRKIYEMEQKLKRLDKEQWEEQQRLRRELQNVNLGNLQAISRNNNKDVGEFYSLKQSLSGQEYGITRSTAVSPVNTPTSDKVTQFRLVDWFAGFMGTGADRGIKSTGSKKYQPESFNDVEIGQPFLQKKQQQPIAGYHYYNVDLPNITWDVVPNDTTSDEWQNYNIGNCQVFTNLISYITTELSHIKQSNTLPVVEQISQLSAQLGCPNTILTAKALDFIVDKLATTYISGTLPKTGQMLNIVTGLLIYILDGMQIETHNT